MGTGRAPDSISRGYVFDNAAEHASARFSALSEIFDPGSIRHLGDRGIQDGWNCLEGGRWRLDRHMALQRVGPAGHVLVTDLNTRFLETLNQPKLGRTLFTRLQAHGLVEVVAEARAFTMPGESPG
jgi:hypothetical protein